MDKTQHIQHLPPALTEEFELQVEPKAVLGVHWNNEIGANDWLVKWKGLHDCETTWVSIYAMNQKYPLFHLEDKVSFELGGIVRPPIIHTYKCKGKKGNAQEDNSANGNK